MSLLRVTKRKFTSPAVTKDGIHYFLQDNYIRRLEDGRISVSVAYYSRNRRKWLCDTHYIDNELAKALILFAFSKGLLDGANTNERCALNDMAGITLN